MNWITKIKTVGCLALFLLSVPVWSGEVPCKNESPFDGKPPELAFSEIFQHPIGPRGIVLSEKVRKLEGKKVCITGYMVKQEQPVPGTILLAPMPITLHEEEYGFCEDLPPVVIHVSFQGDLQKAHPQYVPGAIKLTGTLQVGNRPEPDGRISTLRLQIDSLAAPHGDSLLSQKQNQSITKSK